MYGSANLSCNNISSLFSTRSGRWHLGSYYINMWGTAVAQWLRCCATNRKVAGSIPDRVIGIFHWHNPSDRTMALESTQPLTEMSTRSISGGGKKRPVRKADNLTTILCCCHVIWEPQACNGTDLPYHINTWNLGRQKVLERTCNACIIAKIFEYKEKLLWNCKN